jgi:hypothetical protein
MTQDDVLFGYRLQLFDLAARTTVAHACRTFGVHRSTFYAWKAQVDRQGLEMLRPRERRRPVMPNQLSPIVEQRVVATVKDPEFPGCDHENSPPVIAGRSVLMASRWARMR